MKLSTEHCYRKCSNNGAATQTTKKKQTYGHTDKEYMVAAFRLGIKFPAAISSKYVGRDEESPIDTKAILAGY